MPDDSEEVIMETFYKFDKNYSMHLEKEEFESFYNFARE
jgi:hypothetical protein